VLELTKPELTDGQDIRTGRYDRQVRAFGPAAQRRLGRLTVAVIGVGGVGSLVAQSLAHLGVGRLLLVDPDRVDPSNLNRLAGAEPSDATAGTPKVEVAARVVQRANPDVSVAPVCAGVLDVDVWSGLRVADAIVGAVDGHAARWAMNRLAVQYERWYAHIGVELSRAEAGDSDSGSELEAGGHVAVVRPGGPCLLCMSAYDPRKVGRELDPGLAAARRAAGYRTDDPDEPTPSVVFLNQVLAGHAVGELLNWVCPWRPPAPYLLVDLVAPRTEPLYADRSPDCAACGAGSVRGLSDAGGVPDLAPPTQPPPPELPKPAVATLKPPAAPFSM